MAIPTAQARSVVRYPYLSNKACIIKGRKAPVTPDDADIRPNAIPFLATNHSFNMLTIGYVRVTNPRP